MKTGDWEKAKQIFGAAIKVAPSERLRFLDEVCADDADMRREVESLLVSFDDAESFMEQPAAQDLTGFINGGSKQLEKGIRVGHYEIVRQLGAGGMGQVYLAQDTKLDRRVAIKILNEQVSRNESNLARFIREAKAASGLNHPNILVIHEIGESENSSYIVSEFIEGRTLRELVAASPMKLSDILDITIQIVSALAAAHEANIVHRDIKPENVMVRPDGYVKLLDFGLAKLTEQKPIGLEAATVQQNQTAKGVILGTVNYMSPEQAKGEKVEQRTDIFSLGVVLYEMIAGRTPFAGGSMSETLANLIRTEPLPLARYTSNVPDELQQIVSKMLRKHRDERYQTMKGLLADLKSLQKRLDFEAELGQRKSSEQFADKTSLVFKPNEAIEARTAMLPPATTDAKETPNTEIQTAGGQTLRDKPKPSRTLLIRFLLGLLLIATLGLGYWFYVNRSSATSSKSSPIESIAVMPFVNASGNGEVEYLSDGMTDMLITSLSQLPKLSVKARSSVYRYKGKDGSAQQVGKELNVQAILSGRLVQRGNDLTLHIELVDVKTETALWSADYNRSMTNLAALQSEIARDVSEKLRLRLTSTEKQRLTKQGTENGEAYRAYLKGMFYWNKGMAPGFEKSRDYFQQAIDLDLTYALAYSGLAGYYAFASTAGFLPPNENWPKAEAAANKALALDDTLPETYNTLAAIKLYNYRDWPSAERYFRRGIELDPNSAEIRAHYSLCLAGFERGEEALAEAQHSVELEPLSPRLNYFWGLTLFFMRQYDHAIDQFRKTLELDPNYVMAHESLGDAYEQKGMQREAIAAWAKALTLRGEEQQASILERTYAASGFEAAVRALAKQRLEKLNERMKRGEYVPAAEYVTAYTRMGDKEQAFAWLDKAVQERTGFAFGGKANPIYDKLRDDPRFQASLRNVGF